MNSLVSIIIPAYNAEPFISEAIRSATSQTWLNKEIIVVNDGSLDNTLAKANEFVSRGVKVISQINKGAGAARNRGYMESKGDYIQFLDADDMLAPSKIEMQLKQLHGLDGETICSGRWGLFYDDVGKAQFSPNALWGHFDSSVDWLLTAWTKQIWMHPSAWLTPRCLIEKAGLWNESLSLHDDGEFFCRILLKSKGVLFCDSAISYYRKGVRGSLSSITSDKAIESHSQICQLYEHHLLLVENSPRTRIACASNYLTFYYQHFPGNIEMRQSAYDSAKRLGGANVPSSGTELFHLVKKFVGWKLAKRFERFYYQNGLSRGQLKKRFKW
jgi:glycosyltransferase involved in cell wall biosynthesis